MKIFFDFLPVILFFGTFKYAEGHADWAARFATEHFGFIWSRAAWSAPKRRRCCWPRWS